MLSLCHKEGVSDGNRAGIEAADPALRLQLRFRARTLETGHCYGEQSTSIGAVGSYYERMINYDDPRCDGCSNRDIEEDWRHCNICAAIAG
eukprot:gene23375-biopygen8588